MPITALPGTVWKAPLLDNPNMSMVNACLSKLLGGQSSCLPGLLLAHYPGGDGQLSCLQQHSLCYDLGDAGGAGMRRPRMERTSAVSFT